MTSISPAGINVASRPSVVFVHGDGSWLTDSHGRTLAMMSDAVLEDTIAA